MKEQDILEDQRPVKCAVCQQKMYYFGHPKCEEEVLLTVELPKNQDAVAIKNFYGETAFFGIVKYYIHLRCWNGLPINLSNGKNG